jgi:ribosomal protein S11
MKKQKKSINHSPISKQKDTLPKLFYLAPYVKIQHIKQEGEKLIVRRRNKNLQKIIDQVYLFDEWADRPVFTLFIKSSLRGLHVNLSNKNFKTLRTFSLGKMGYKKAQRYSPLVIKEMVVKVLEFMAEELKLGDCLKPFNLRIVINGSSTQLRRFKMYLFQYDYIKENTSIFLDITDIPYNGCRPRKSRRK